MCQPLFTPPCRSLSTRHAGSLPVHCVQSTRNARRSSDSSSPCHVVLSVRTMSCHGVAMLIYKILLPSEWAEFESAGRVDGSPFDRSSGFVHCSSREQVSGTAQRVFGDESRLVVVAVDAQAVSESLSWEAAPDGARTHTCTRLCRSTRWWRFTALPVDQQSTRSCHGSSAACVESVASRKRRPSLIQRTVMDYISESRMPASCLSRSRRLLCVCTLNTQIRKP
jgi:uncharacterized protein (DUF952 family)